MTNPEREPTGARALEATRREALEDIRRACPACDNGNVPSGLTGSDEPAWSECQYCGELLRALLPPLEGSPAGEGE